jgi:molybdate transport system ATP-binding protein
MTLSCVAGLQQPDAGRIVVGEHPLFDSAQRLNLPPQRRRVGLVSQQYLLFPHLTVGQNVAFGLTGHSRDERDRIVEEMLALVGLEGAAPIRPGLLSGGQQQRVALARALVTRPRVMLLDEPFSAVDGPTRARLRRDLMRIIHGELRIPSLFVTHDLAEAYLLADHIVVLEAGRVLQEGPPREIVYHPANQRVASLTGSHNFYEATVMGRDEEGTTLRVGDVTLCGPPLEAVVGSRVTITVRPERVMLVRKDAPTEPRENEVRGRILNEMTDGLNHTLFFRLDEGQRLQPGAYDLEIVLPAYIYERLNLEREKRWRATIKREAIAYLADE